MTATAYHHPDGTAYRDTGCASASSCLGCPWAHCRYESPAAHLRELSRARAQAAAREIRQAGLTAEQAAERLGVTPRTVFRMLARAREAA